MKITKAQLYNLLYNPVGSPEARSIYRVGQALYNITVFNNKAEKLLNTMIENKYRKARRYAKYKKDISKINQVLTMLLNEKRRNSYKRILVKLRKNIMLFDSLFNPMLGIFHEQEGLYREIIDNLNAATESELAFRRILSEKSFSPDDSNLNDNFIVCLQAIKPEIEKLIKLNCELIKVYFDEIRKDGNTDVKYRYTELKCISKQIRKNQI